MSEIPVTHRDIDGLRTAVAMTGDGPPVLLLHGWGVDMHTMWPVASKLAEVGFQAHCIDFPGFGQTQLPPQAWSVLEYAQWTNCYLDAAGLEQVFLIGHSFGGRVSLVLGADYADRIHKIALSNSAGVRQPPSVRYQLYRAGNRVLMTALSLPGLGGVKQSVRQRLRQRFASEDYLNAGPLEDTFKLVVAQDLLPYARRVQAPTLLFWGDQDTDTPLTAGQTLEREMPDAALILFNGAGHYAYLDHLAKFIQVVTHFFSEA